MLPTRRNSRRRTAFTLIELMIVVAVLAIIAGLVVPQVESAMDDARHSAMLHDLHELTAAVERFRMEHGGTPPELANKTLPQLLNATDTYGEIGRGPTYVFGPYLLRVPQNPLNGSGEIYYSADSPPANLSNRVGWVYHTETGQIWGGLSQQRVRSGGSGS